jgi:glycosyltransferase involved in cell wall biosynthesis
MGNIEPEKLRYEFIKYHLLILPRPLNKRTKYGFSTKLSEYLVSGVPVLLTDVSDNALYIKDNFNGYLIPPGSANALAEKLVYIIRHYNEQAKNIVDNAYKTVREDLDLRLFTDKFADFFYDGMGKLNRSA